MTTLLRGCGTALVTPFAPDGSIDETSLGNLVTMQIEAGIDFLVPCGSTGEAATLSLDEHVRVVRLTAEIANGRLPVIAGAGASDTARAIALAEGSKAAGATHLLVVSPMYNKPPQRGVIAHMRAIADATDLPVVIYNVPGRTGGNIEPATVLELAGDPRFVAVKEASGRLEQVESILAERPAQFAVLSGDDALTLPIMALGGEGIVSVVSNIFPAAMVAITRAMVRGDAAHARALHFALRPIFSAAFIESNPMPTKAALAADGQMHDVLRLPLVPLAAAPRETLLAAVAQVRAALDALDLSARTPDPLH